VVDRSIKYALCPMSTQRKQSSAGDKKIRWLSGWKQKQP